MKADDKTVKMKMNGKLYELTELPFGSVWVEVKGERK